MLGWAPVLPAPAAGAPFGSRSAQSAEAQHRRFVQRELAELKSEMALLRQAAPGKVLALQDSPTESNVTPPRATPPPIPPRSATTAARPVPPPPPPPPPPSAARAAPPPASASKDPDGKSDLLAAIRAAGGALRQIAAAPSDTTNTPAPVAEPSISPILPAAPTPADETQEPEPEGPPPVPAYTPTAFSDAAAAATATSVLDRSGRPDMRAIIPNTPPTLRRAADHSPGGTPAMTERSTTAMSEIESHLQSALKDKFRHINESLESQEGAARTDSENSAWGSCVLSPRSSAFKCVVRVQTRNLWLGLGC